MPKIKESYTGKEFKRNKTIFLIIKLVIGITYLFIFSIFLLMLQSTSFSFFGIVIATIVCFVAYKAIQSEENQNKTDIMRNNNTWGKGLKAETTVLHSLSTLPGTFKIINDFYTGRGNIDFIVIGPTGIFTIEVKATNGTISYYDDRLQINNQMPEKDYIRQTEAERLWLQNTLHQKFDNNYAVTGLLEFPFGQIDKNTIKGPVRENLWVGEGNFHLYMIRKSRNTLSQDEILSIYNFISSYV